MNLRVPKARKLRASMRKRVDDLRAIQDEPESITRGFALGIFIGCLPLMGAQLVVVIFLAMLVRLNKIAAISGTLVAANPFTAIPIYLLYLKIGIWVLGLPSEQFGFAALTTFHDIGNLGTELLGALLVGCLIFAMIAATVCYFLLRVFIFRYSNVNLKDTLSK